jgi:prephenate dehydratase
LRHAERIDATSTSKAAELVASDQSGESAAICSPLAAELYGLDVLVPSIEERKGNTTRFLVLRNSTDVQVTLDPAGLQVSQCEGRYKTLISFTIRHSQPASLANALAVFGKHGINLTSLNSRPHSDRKWNYIFFVEFWGRKGDAEVEAVLKGVAEVVEGWKWIGSWISKGDGG